MNLEQIKQQAQDKTTLPEILIELSKHQARQIRQYVAANPNTPLEALEKLGAEFPANPIFDLLRFENAANNFGL